MEIICSTDGAVLQPLFSDMAGTYQEAFALDWGEVSKCRSTSTPDRQRCVGTFTDQAVGEICLDCALCVQEPAYTEQECVRMFDELLDRGAAFYVERDERGVLMTTIGVPESVGELTRSKYADTPEMATWLVNMFGEETTATYLTESFANRRLRPNGNMRNREASVRQIVDQTGLRLVMTRTKSPAVVAATLRAFPGARLYLPDAGNQSEWNSGLVQFSDRATGTAPDRRAFLVWEVE